MMGMFAKRRLIASALTVAAGAGLVAAVLAWAPAPPSLRGTAYFTGWVLFGALVLLALYNARKKLPYPPLLGSSVWLQLHAYLGIWSLLAFLLHLRFRFPTGPFEITLAGLFAGVAGSGIVGLWLSRAVPPRLREGGEEVLFERIPMFRRRLRERAEELVVTSVRESEATTLADFYADRLEDFFRGPRNFFLHLIQSTGPLDRLTGQLDVLERYLDDGERRIARELRELIETKHQLDHQWALQGLLKGWLFVHVPLTYALAVFVAVHVVLVYYFVGAGS